MKIKFPKRIRKTDPLSSGKCSFYDGSSFEFGFFVGDLLKESKSCPICALFLDALCTFYGSNIGDYGYYVYAFELDDAPLRLWISDDDFGDYDDERKLEYFGLEFYTLPGT